MSDQVAVVGVDCSPAGDTVTTPTAPSRRLRLVSAALGQGPASARTRQTASALTLPDDVDAAQQVVISHPSVPPGATGRPI